MCPVAPFPQGALLPIITSNNHSQEKRFTNEPHVVTLPLVWPFIFTGWFGGCGSSTIMKPMPRYVRWCDAKKHQAFDGWMLFNSVRSLYAEVKIQSHFTLVGFDFVMFGCKWISILDRFGWIPTCSGWNHHLSISEPRSKLWRRQNSGERKPV